ncbi:MAG: hypothetical protein ACI9QQ_002128 [Myxococcota bacterium]
MTESSPSKQPSHTQRIPSRLGRFLRSPLLHFVVLGTLIYVANNTQSAAAPSFVRVTADDITQLEDQWQRTSGRAPNAMERDRLIDQFVDDELLLVVARSLGWDRNDPVVHRRLIQNVRFLGAAEEQSDEEVLDEAYAMAMEKSDIVVRRRMLERMRLMIAEQARSKIPSDEVLESYLVEHADAFMRPAQIRVTQVHLSRDRRGEALHQDAVALVRELAESGLNPETALDEVVAKSDPFLLQAQLPQWSKRRLGERLGPAFAEGAFKLAVGVWAGPVISSYGEHAVWVHEKIPAVLPELAAIKDKVTAEVHRRMEREALREALIELRELTEIEIAGRE